MLKNADLTKMLFFDIETVSSHAVLDHLPEPMRSLWNHRAKYLMDRKGYETPAEAYEGEGGIYAEFAKVVCISVGMLVPNKTTPETYGIRLRSFYNHDESALLQEFSDFIHEKCSKKENNGDFCFKLVGHNIKEFDIPFLSRRLLINGICLPEFMDCTGLKPWQVPHIDTMEFWKFGDYKSFTALNLLAGIFGIPTPKDDISGADVGRVYYQENDLPRISVYCKKDVLTVAQLVLKWRNLPMVQEAHVSHADAV